MPRVTRRTFLLSSATILAAGAAVAGASGWAFLSTRPEEVVARIVHHRFPEVRIAPEDLDTFARDFLTYDRTSQEKLAALRAVLPVMQSETLSALLPARVRELYDGFERRIVTKFTLSTDFFQRPQGDDRPLTYFGFADPYLLGCANPLARFDMEAA